MVLCDYRYVFYFKQKTAYEIMPSLVGSEMCIRDRTKIVTTDGCSRAAMSGICADPAPAAIAPSEGDPDADPDRLAPALPVALGVELGLDCARLIGLLPVQAAADTGTPIATPMATATRTPRPTSAGASPSGSASGSPSLGAIAAGAGSAQIPDIAARLQPSVVTIFVGQGLGSGVVYTADGLILTNEHVVRGATAVQVGFADGSRVTGTVRATDAVTDLALVQADRTNLPVPTYQTILSRIGDLDVVIGSPLGFENTVTAGIVSGLHREIPGSAAEGQALVELLQTDAAISPGISGGAVVNGAGEVIGGS